MVGGYMQIDIFFWRLLIRFSILHATVMCDKEVITIFSFVINFHPFHIPFKVEFSTRNTTMEEIRKYHLIMEKFDKERNKIEE